MKNAYQDGRVLDVELATAVASGGVVVKGGAALEALAAKEIQTTPQALGPVQ